MIVTREMTGARLTAYLRSELSLEELVDWAERQVMEAQFDSTPVRDVVARLGVADVRAFGLTWEDCRRLLDLLGLKAQVNVHAA